MGTRVHTRPSSTLSGASSFLRNARREAGVHGVSECVSIGSSECWLFLRVMLRCMNITRKQGQHGLLTRVYTRPSLLFLRNALREAGVHGVSPLLNLTQLDELSCGSA